MSPARYPGGTKWGRNTHTIVNEIENCVYDIARFFGCPVRGERNDITKYIVNENLIFVYYI